MHASAKTMLRETKTKRHRCEFADSVDSKSKRRKRAQQPRLQERMLQVNRQGDWIERRGCARRSEKVHLPERRIIRCFSKSIAEGIRCGPTKELRLNPMRLLKQRNLIRDADITRQILCEKVSKNHFFNSLLTEGIGCGPTRELRLKPTRILKQGNLIKDTKKTQKKCEQIAKKLLDFLGHHGCVGFQEKQ